MEQNYLYIKGGVGVESLSPNSDMYYADMILPVSAYPQSGYEFDYWSDPHGILSDTSNSSTDANISDIDVLAEITAYFKPMEYNSVMSIYRLKMGVRLFLRRTNLASLPILDNIH